MRRAGASVSLARCLARVFTHRSFGGGGIAHRSGLMRLRWSAAVGGSDPSDKRMPAKGKGRLEAKTFSYF
jgi:hypothetical protein